MKKKFVLQYYINWPNFITKLCFTPKLFNNMFRVSCLGIWWRHDIWISEKWKTDYLKNEKSFRNEIKYIFPCFTSALRALARKLKLMTFSWNLEIRIVFTKGCHHGWLQEFFVATRRALENAIMGKKYFKENHWEMFFFFVYNKFGCRNT